MQPYRHVQSYSNSAQYIMHLALIFHLLLSAPSGIDQPRVLEQGSLYLYLGWNEPIELNGIIVGYQLFKDGQQIYTGALLEFNVTDLDVSNYGMLLFF